VTEISIERLDREELQRLEPLWLELLAHHALVSAPEMPPQVHPDVSWQRRRAAYADWLSHPRAFGLLAVCDDRTVGYAVVSIHGGEVLGTTWDGGSEVAELETLIVTAHRRSSGIGARLLDRAESEVRARGIDQMIIAAVASNDDAVSFYRRRGYTPYLTYLYARLDRAD
jgi:GNAT superfamily N-acetyltransferase